jgi:hypothetical protein
MQVLYPNHMHLNRGNHETVNMNKMYGFEVSFAPISASQSTFFMCNGRALPCISLGVVSPYSRGPEIASPEIASLAGIQKIKMFKSFRRFANMARKIH